MKTIDIIDNITNNYSQPSPKLISDICKRLSDVPKDVLERAHHAFMHQPIQAAGSILYKAGVCLGSHELYEYRKTLFSPNALVDPLTQGPPQLADCGCGEAQPQRSDVPNPSPKSIIPILPIIPNPEPDRSADSLSAAAPTRDEPHQLHQARQRLVQLLAARAQQTTDNEPSNSVGENAQQTNPESRTLNSEPAPLVPPTARLNGLGLEDIHPWPEPVGGAALLDELRHVLRRYVVLPGMAPETLALWVVHTYAFELRNVSTYIGLGSPQKRCGKTTLLTVLTELVSRPVVASNISPPALFRAIEEARPTLLIDEADTFLQANDEMRGILNSGYTRKTAFVLRVANESQPRSRRGNEADSCNLVTHLTHATHVTQATNVTDASRLVRFSCWCPKVIAAIGRLPDTLLDRCIPITMQRKTPEETCERLRHLDGHTLRRKCARFVADHTRDIAAARPQIPAQLNDRAADIWEPLLVIADLAGAHWPKLARDAALQTSAGMPDTTVIGSLLIDILFTFVEDDLERISSRALVDSLNRFRDRPWAEARKHKEIDGLWLSQQLRPYGVRPKAMWLDNRTVKGYAKSDFAEIWPRYVSRSDFDTLLSDRGVSDPVGPSVPVEPNCPSVAQASSPASSGGVPPPSDTTNR